MKKLFLGLVLFSFITASVYSENLTLLKNNNTTKYSGKAEGDSHLIENNKTIKLTGKISITDDSVVQLITNWKTRSKKTYQITGENKELLIKHKDKIIIAECIMLEEKAWSGNIDIKKFSLANKKKTKQSNNIIKK